MVVGGGIDVTTTDAAHPREELDHAYIQVSPRAPRVAPAPRPTTPVQLAGAADRTERELLDRSPLRRVPRAAVYRHDTPDPLGRMDDRQLPDRPNDPHRRNRGV